MSDCIYKTNCLKEEQKFYRENFITDETAPEDIATEDLEDSDYKYLRIAIDTVERLMDSDNEILQNYRKMMDKIEILTDGYVESGDFNGVPPYIEKLKAQLSDPYGGNQTCAELLQNYRDEMNIIEKIDEDECLEDISLVAPYIKRLKHENDTLKALVKECLVVMTHEEKKEQ